MVQTFSGGWAKKMSLERPYPKNDDHTGLVFDTYYLAVWCWSFQRAHLSTKYEECFNTLPVPTYASDCPYRCKYVYGYGVDGSDRPSYLLWPRRGSDGHSG